MNKIYKILSWMMSVVLCSTITMAAPQTRNFSMQEMFKLADNHNLSVQTKLMASEEASSAIRSAKNSYLPGLSFFASAAYNDSGTIMNRNFSNPISADVPHFANSFALEATQVIFTGGAIRNGVKIAKLQSSLADLQLKNTKQETHFLVAGYYIELFKINNQLKIFESHIEQTQKMLENMRHRYKAGTTLHNDITRYELKLQNLKYAQIQLQNSATIVNDRLVSALQLEENTLISPTSLELPSSSDQPLNYWLETSQQSSPAIAITQTAIELNKAAERITKAQRWPKLEIYAGGYVNGPITTEIPPIDKNFSALAVGARLQYDFSNFYKTGKDLKKNRLAVAKSKAENKVAEEEIRLAVDDAYTHYKESFDLLTTKEKSFELASKNYNTVSYRYENGLALITDLLDASAEKLDAELEKSNASANIVFNYYKLQYVAGKI